ncbi:MAG: hypothetical protein RI554_08050 [Trueperaceae bacterium]|nr:hypothetical protein [Trueperaceae bacterium]
MEFGVETEGFYWGPNNELRACLITVVNDEMVVIDKETNELLPIPATDVLIEKPEP